MKINIIRIMVNNIDKEKKSHIIGFIDKRINTNNNNIDKHIRKNIKIIKTLKLQQQRLVFFFFLYNFHYIL